MRPEERDIALLWGMREAAREVADFTRGSPTLSSLHEKSFATRLKGKSRSSARPRDECPTVSRELTQKSRGVASSDSETCWPISLPLALPSRNSWLPQPHPFQRVASPDPKNW